MFKRFEKIMNSLICSKDNELPPIGINISNQFCPDGNDETSIHKILNSAFLILLSGKEHPDYKLAQNYFEKKKNEAKWKEIVEFYNNGLKLIRSEITNLLSEDKNFKQDVEQLYCSLSKNSSNANKSENIEMIHKVFFPEGVGILKNIEQEVALLREKRKVKITKLNPKPIQNPIAEILFTSNCLLTIPAVETDIKKIPYSSAFKNKLKKVINEKQKFWYDHPVQIGVSQKENEIIHGLKGLDKTVQFEKELGLIHDELKLDVVLSASVTHDGLHEIAGEYIGKEIERSGGFKNLEIYIFTENDVKQILDEIIVPAANKYLTNENIKVLFKIFGVDGEYGRHFSFLKAISAFWQVFINPCLKGTFKIDLDQVFPQNELIESCGKSAFENFKTPLWGAEGEDSFNNKIILGMIAGSLVNEKNISKSLFTPDIIFPENIAKGDELIFYSRLPQALSTRAEMTTRYNKENIDGINHCIQRIHVTGGTTGILIKSLRDYKPFTPSFIGRAEDQAYILSILYQQSKRKLRYLHKDCLIMRHDKESFTQTAIQKASLGKILGDYIRILLFTYYAKALPNSFEKIKKEVDPFTGAFISRIPITIVYLRFAFKISEFFSIKNTEKRGHQFMKLGVKRLSEIIPKLTLTSNPIKKEYLEEKAGWNLYYEILDCIEEKIKVQDRFALQLKNKSKNIIEKIKVKS